MNWETEVDRVLELMYESALTPERLPEAVAAMTAILDGDTCHLVGWDRCSGLPTVSVMTGLPEVLGHEYAAHYGALDPRRNLLITQEPGHLMNCQEHFDDRFVSRSEFFQDYLLPKVGVQYLLAAGDLVEASGNLILIGFQRYVGHGPFSANESTTLERLLPHLRRSLRLLMSIEKERSLGKAVTEISNLGMLALSSFRTVLWTNPQGLALLRGARWLREVAGRLCATNASRDAALQRAIQDVLATGRPVNINLATPGSGEHCCVTLVALRYNANVATLDQSAAVMAVVTTSGSRRLASIRQLMELFGLTPAEARLARALAVGESLESYAKLEGIQKTTVRTQLQSAFAKTATATQKDLVGLVVSLHPVRA